MPNFQFTTIQKEKGCTTFAYLGSRIAFKQNNQCDNNVQAKLRASFSGEVLAEQSNNVEKAFPLSKEILVVLHKTAAHMCL
jgi:hydroxyethylthiazole kinase-like sugar kinase family protein